MTIWVLETVDTNGQLMWVSSGTGYTPQLEHALWFVRREDAQVFVDSLRLYTGIGGEPKEKQV